MLTFCTTLCLMHSQRGAHSLTIISDGFDWPRGETKVFPNLTHIANIGENESILCFIDSMQKHEKQFVVRKWFWITDIYSPSFESRIGSTLSDWNTIFSPDCWQLFPRMGYSIPYSCRRYLCSCMNTDLGVYDKDFDITCPLKMTPVCSARCWP